MGNGTEPAPGALGRPRLCASATRTDRALSELSAVADPLLAVTPVDAAAARKRFRADGFAREPQFQYRELTVDPDRVKAALYELPVDDVEDPALARLFREKRHELDAQLDLLLRRNTASFLPSSMVLYGTAEPELVTLAHRVLALVATAADDDERTDDSGPPVGAAAFALRARTEIDRLREWLPDLQVDIEIRDDLTGLMVERGRLLIGSGLAVDEARVDALVQHEVGTHVLTWVNGGHRPLGLLQVGLPLYDETQEALAVLAEYLVGGLTPARMATLATRVLAAHCVAEGASFVETFRFVRAQSGLAEASAFDLTMRVHSGGGFTKDVIYLRGVHRLLAHLGDGGRIESLLPGKLPLRHLAVVEELRGRGVLVAPVLLPSWLSWPESQARQDALATGIGVEDLIQGEPP